MKKLNLKVKSWKIVEQEKIVMGGYRDDPKWISGKSFGASAGMIHRISGYMLSVMIPIVPTMAEIVLCRYYNRKIPKQIVSNFNHYKFLDKFYHLGQRMLLSMNHQQLNDFFYAFFQLPEKDIYNFLNQRMNLLMFLKPTKNNINLIIQVCKNIFRLSS